MAMCAGCLSPEPDVAPYRANCYTEVLILIGGDLVSSYSIDVHLYMEKGMYARLVERGQELGIPLSAVVREAVVGYFENIPEVPEQGSPSALPDDTIWQLP